ncbi:polysaccharide deacetylase family protein [Paenibacillus sp. A3M_27_13]|uniref:polysaccharide deacetylase family protein n=1 Tax=Paenibacillus sp. A3M_27_13 TaxID=2962029 RepID=UPI0020B8A6E9|nr:polysaccharide deacetylase family protein [Paenibacillus sp. A3M_27_13]MCP3746736.1 polysaccharide deacetylase family protein [Paenibacillus sp. A3M_27_13]
MDSWPVLYRVDTKKKVVALTFDVANGRRVPLRMLSLLQEHGIHKATFFLTGIWTEMHPQVARKIREKGFEIGSHGYRHQDYRRQNNAWIEHEVKKAGKAIFKETGVRTRLFRPPGGDMNPRVVRKLRTLDQLIVHWDVDSLDWKLTDIYKIVKRVVPHARGGSILLLHACDPWYQSLTALPVILKKLRKKGFHFVTVSELMRMQRQAQAVGGSL